MRLLYFLNKTFINDASIFGSCRPKYPELKTLIGERWSITTKYKSSEIIRINGRSSEKFHIVDRVKQGGVLSPFLFNVYINGLIESCVKKNIEACIGPHNVSVISYCDDITLLNSSIYQMNELLSMCGAYADKWRLSLV